MDQLARRCESLKGEKDDAGDRFDVLLKSLLISGLENGDRSLTVDIENRVQAMYGERAMHRGSALLSLASKLGERFRSLAQREPIKRTEKH